MKPSTILMIEDYPAVAQSLQDGLSRAQIVEAVWGRSTDFDNEQAVNVHIRRLREKVETDFSRPVLILTVPGLGYKLAREITK